MGDRFGRIATIGFGCIWTIIGATLQCSAMNADWMFCARVFTGIGTGILNAITPVWATETASHTSRGAFGKSNESIFETCRANRLSLDRVYLKHIWRGCCILARVWNELLWRWNI